MQVLFPCAIAPPSFRVCLGVVQIAAPRVLTSILVIIIYVRSCQNVYCENRSLVQNGRYRQTKWINYTTEWNMYISCRSFSLVCCSIRQQTQLGYLVCLRQLCCSLFFGLVKRRCQVFKFTQIVVTCWTVQCNCILKFIIFLNILYKWYEHIK